MDLSHTQTLKFDAGDILFSTGGKPDSAYIVLSGRVCVEEDNNTAPIIIGPGEIIGEIDLLFGQPHSATVVALSPVSVVPLTRRQLADAMRTAPHATAAHVSDVAAVLARQITEVLGTRDAPESPSVPPPRPVSAVTWTGILISAETRDLALQVDSERLTDKDLPFTVGRKPSRREKTPRQHVDLVLTDHKPYNLSRRHFVIDVDDGVPVLRDIGSLLGTEVNGVRLGPGRLANKAALLPGRNLVVAGATTSPFRFVITIEAD